MANHVELKYSNINDYISILKQIDDKLEYAYKQLAESTDFGSTAMQATWSFGSKKAIFNTLSQNKKDIKRMRDVNEDLMIIINSLDDNYEKVAKKSKKDIATERRIAQMPDWIKIARLIITPVILPFMGLWAGPAVISVWNDIIGPWLEPDFILDDNIVVPDTSGGNNTNGNTSGGAGSSGSSSQNTQANKTEDVDYLTAEEFARLKAELEKYKNSPYVPGGTSVNGVDCSGLVMCVFRDAGICNLPHNAAEIYKTTNHVGSFSPKAVDFSLLKPGDIICYSNSTGENSGHVAIYMGDGKVMHARNEEDDVVVTDISSTYYTNLYVCRPKK